MGGVARGLVVDNLGSALHRDHGVHLSVSISFSCLVTPFRGLQEQAAQPSLRVSTGEGERVQDCIASSGSQDGEEE